MSSAFISQPLYHNIQSRVGACTLTSIIDSSTEAGNLRQGYGSITPPLAITQLYAHYTYTHIHWHTLPPLHTCTHIHNHAMRPFLSLSPPSSCTESPPLWNYVVPFPLAFFWQNEVKSWSRSRFCVNTVKYSVPLDFFTTAVFHPDQVQKLHSSN